ncbi:MULTISPECIES: hypothetical protein [unclassified Psychrobacter]|uniref:hypothetical protein n=1 Tax=unclassified Psychrobacter TaxID=196806 RepID=UPI000868D917|nr:hypothetical protein [Psychrobacter sp. B29-1]OEH68547.1 MAG: hypothetical protein BAX61_07285 [Psychrobacter sp. B29-1]
MSKLISTFQIGFDDETKAVLSELKDKLDAITGSLGVPSALLGSTKPNGGLLVAMSEAANDAPESELKQMGQWVFEGQPKEFVTAHVNSFGAAAISSMPIGDIEPSTDTWSVKQDAQVTTPTCLYRELKGKFDATNWQNSAISRQPVNDVYYLSETVPEIQGIDACDIIIDEMGRDYSHNSNCLSAVVPQITQADMQLIFIKNLSDVLIQRMHSMDRFSEDDYHVGGDKLMSWDIIISPDDNKFGFITGHALDNSEFSLFFIGFFAEDTRLASALYKSALELCELKTRTITEAEIPAFRAALEACYA